ncbi:MAG: hypothetical protein WCT29_02195 [Candidatus Paceibacterota bacterium]|jgi:hypothetical protein
MGGRKLLKLLSVLIFVIFFINFSANTFYWYSSIGYFDTIVHYFGGAWVGFFTLYLSSEELPSARLVIKVLISVLLVGVCWEAYELIIDKVVSGNFLNPLDTVSDLFFDFAGGASALLYYIYKIMSLRTSKVQSQ